VQRILENARALEAQLASLNASLKEPLPQQGWAERVQRAGAELESIDRMAYDLEADLGPLLVPLPYLEPIPLIGGDAAAAPRLLSLVHHGASLGRHLEKMAPPLIDAFESDQASSAPRLARVTTTLQAQQPEIAAALQELDALSQERQHIHGANLSRRVARYLEFFDTQLPRLRDALVAAQWLPDALGANEPRRYLLIFQNVDEIRATGGFISAAGVMTLDQGKIVALSFSDSLGVDDLSKPHPFPPTPLTEYMQAGVWMFRDTNWSPDLPSAARVMQSLYALDQGVTTDGVITVDETAVMRFLDALSGLDLPTYQVRVTSVNIMPLIKQYYGQPIGVGGTRSPEDHSWYAHRKDFMGEVLRTFIARLQVERLDLNVWAQTLTTTARERHVQVYFASPEAEALLKHYQLDGAIPRVPGEYLQLVDSNVGFNKVSSRVLVQLSARFTLKPNERTRVAVMLTYTNTNALREGECVQENYYESDYAKMQAACYWNYVRLYVTNGSQFISAAGGGVPELQPPEGEGQATGFGSYLVVPTAATRNLSFEYWGAPLADRTFQLLVQKQAGLPTLPVVIEVDFPENWSVKESDLKPTVIQPGRVIFQIILTTDQNFRVLFAAEGLR
jgi:hypothetical protein